VRVFGPLRRTQTTEKGKKQTNAKDKILNQYVWYVH